MNDGNTMNHATHIRRETFISAIINGVLSLLFFLAFFLGVNPVPVWGLGNLVFDFLPQSFMIALMSTLVPGFLTARKIRTGILAANGPPNRLPKRLVSRALLLGVASALLGTAAMATLASLSGIAELAPITAAAVKIAYGVVLAIIVTPPGLRAALAKDDCTMPVRA